MIAPVTLCYWSRTNAANLIKAPSLKFRKFSLLSPSAMSTHNAEKDVDMDQPASSILKAGTTAIHEEVEKSVGQFEFDREEYIRYLMMFWHIYKYAFSSISAHSDH
jgi:hypothetical protein